MRIFLIITQEGAMGVRSAFQKVESRLTERCLVCGQIPWHVDQE